MRAEVIPSDAPSLRRRMAAVSPGRVRWTVFAVLAIPFVIAAAALRSRHWYPVLDLAMTELRVRDVLGRHSPLIGLPGRIGNFPDQGSHPGPLSFYLLAPIYRLVGSSAWGLLLGMIVLDLVAIALLLWIAQRRGGTRLVVGVGGLMIVVLHGYGMGVLTQPWNPYLPLLFWLVVLLATWSVLLGDHRMIVLVAAAGSLCAQTHVPYLGLCVAMGAVGLASLAVSWVRHPVGRKTIRSSAGMAVVVIAVLWSPVILDQVRHDPGNLSMLIDYFRHPPEQPVGLGEGIRLLLRHLDIVRIVRDSIGVADPAGGAFVEAGQQVGGTVLPGFVLLLVWLGSVEVARRMRHRRLLALDLVLAVGLTVGTISMGRIFGKVWYYLTLWAWSLTILMVVAMLWTLFSWLGLRDQRVRVGRLRPAIAILAVVAAIGTYVPFVVDGARAEVPEAYLSDSLRALVGPTAQALLDRVGAATGKDGTYVVTWSDALYFGSQGYGLVSELERRGFHAGVPNTWRVPVTRQRVIPDGTATAEIRLVTGSYIEQFRATAGAEEVAYVEPRSAAQLAEYEQLDGRLRDALGAAGFDDLVAEIDTNLFGIQLDPRVSPELQSVVDRMLHLGQPEAVFVIPPGVDQL